MKKRLLKAAIAAALAVAFAAPAFANPFSDVPTNSWAYAAVQKLVDAGVVDGYGDGTFRGDKPMTRYEMAQIVAKAMDKNLSGDQKATVDKLAKEFSEELNAMGVKVDNLQNQVDNMVKFNGDARLRYLSANNDTGNAYNDHFDYRLRLGASGKINDDMGVYARFTTGNMDPSTTGNASASIDNAYVTFNALGLNGKIGRQDYDLGQGLLAGAGSNAILNGVSFKSGNFFAFGGKEQYGVTADQNATATYGDSYGAQYTFNAANTPITAAYLKLNDKEYASAGLAHNFGDLGLSGEYAWNTTDSANAYQVKATLGNTGLSVAYKDVEQGALPFDSALNLKTGMNDFYAVSQTQEAKGLEYEYTKNFNKNTNLDVLYQDIQNSGKNVRAAVNVKF